MTKIYQKLSLMIRLQLSGFIFLYGLYKKHPNLPKLLRSLLVYLSDEDHLTTTFFICQQQISIFSIIFFRVYFHLSQKIKIQPSTVFTNDSDVLPQTYFSVLEIHPIALMYKTEVLLLQTPLYFVEDSQVSYQKAFSAKYLRVPPHHSHDDIVPKKKKKMQRLALSVSEASLSK